MARILCCGIVTLDIINHLPHYPAEDEELRATEQTRHSGGNAANTARVLAQHGHTVALASTVADDDGGDWLLRCLQQARVDTSPCIRLPGSTPTSWILLNSQNGSRTIVHYRNLEELHATDLIGQLPAKLDWVHCEGRNIDEVETLLHHLRRSHPNCRISLEAEKHREGLERLFPLADVIMFSRPWAENAGYDHPEKLLAAIRDTHPNTILSCTWGEAGAWYCADDGDLRHVPATPVKQVVDTIGAGDTFNAGLIHALATHEPIDIALHYATRLAARKIAQHGFDHLVT